MDINLTVSQIPLLTKSAVRRTNPLTIIKKSVNICFICVICVLKTFHQIALINNQ